MTASFEPACESGTLVIGYGNPLLGDDAAGWRAVELIAAWHRPDVHALAVHQLVPELVERFVGARQVIFVDASLAHDSEPVRVRPLTAAGHGPLLGHISDPAWLLGLAQVLHERTIPAWLVTVRATCLDSGQPLSHQAEQGLAQAVSSIARLLERVAGDA